MAQRFLTRLDEGVDQFTFQTFDDNAIRPGERRAHLAQIRHGTLEDLSKWLVEMNRSGAGIFVTVNETDGRGRKKDNIKKGSRCVAGGRWSWSRVATGTAH
jgi:hypothetical protein